MKNIFIIAVCGLMFTSLSAMHLPDDVEVVRQDQIIMSERLHSFDYSLTASELNYSLTTEATVEPMFQMVDSGSESMPQYVASVALNDLSHFYKPVMYEQDNISWYVSDQYSMYRTKAPSVIYKTLSQTPLPWFENVPWHWNIDKVVFS